MKKKEEEKKLLWLIQGLRICV